MKINLGEVESMILPILREKFQGGPLDNSMKHRMKAEVRHLLEHMTDMGYLVDIPAVSLVIKPSELGVVMHCTGEGDVVVELQVKPPVEAAHIDVTVKDWTDRPTSGM